jgi:hypothetical protein
VEPGVSSYFSISSKKVSGKHCGSFLEQRVSPIEELTKGHHAELKYLEEIPNKELFTDWEAEAGSLRAQE